MKKRPNPPLHIAIIIDDFYPASGGVARSVQTQINELVYRGHTVTLLAPAHHLQKPESCETLVIPSLYIPKTPSYMCILRYSRRYAKRISAQHSFDIIHSQTERGALILASHIARVQQIPHVHTFHANLAGTHETDPSMSFWGSMAYALLINPSIAITSKKRFNDPIFLPQPSPDATSFFARFDWHSMATIASRVDAYTTPALFMKQRINECSDGFANKGTIIPTGVNPLFTQAIRQAVRKRTDDTVRFLCVSRLSKEKRVDVALDAFIQAALPHSRLDIVGSGDQSTTLQKTAATHKNVFFHPHTTDMDILASLYVNADAFIMPSYRFDTQAITLSEAAVAGLPIIYCDDRLDVGVCSANSILTEDPEPSAIARAIRLLSNDKRRQSMAQSSQAIAGTLQPEPMIRAYLQLYRETIASHKLH